MAIKKIIIVMLMGVGFAFPEKPDMMPRTFFRIRVINEDDITEIFPGDIKIIKIEIEARPASTIEKIEYVSGAGMELLSPFPSYGKKTFFPGEVMFIEFRVRATIRGSQSFWLRIYSHDEKGNPDPGVSSVGGLTIYNYQTMSGRSPGLLRYGEEGSATKELLLAEKEEKVRRGPPIRIELAFVAGSGHTLTREERVAIQRDITGQNTPQWYKDWIFTNHWYKEWIKRDLNRPVFLGQWVECIHAAVF